MRIGRQRFRDLSAFESSPAFTERERAALAYASALHDSPRVGDDVMARLRRCFDEREIVELVFVCAAERYFTCVALPLGIRSDGLAAEPAR
jgi:alkylhydroperoxidase family enzyme